MNTTETHVIIARIEKGIKRILNRVSINTFIFLAVVFIVCWLVTLSLHLQTQQAAAYALANDAYKQSIANKERQDVSDKQLLDYIKRVVETWDKLQRDNPKVRVPKGPGERPSWLPPLTDKDLERSHPTPTPTPSPSATVAKPHNKKHKPTPTPEPWWKFWKK